MVFKPKLFKEPVKKRFKVFKVELELDQGRTGIRPRSNHDDVIINVVIN